MDKILTISIAAYNAEQTIKTAIDSVINSDVLDEIEIIVINDGSTDNTKAIVEEYVKKYPSVINVINKDNGGWGSTVNTSSKVAKGKYFKLLDADDTFETANLKAFIEYLRECESDIIFTDFDYVYPNHSDKVVYPYEPKKNLPIVEAQKYLMHGMTMKTSVIKGHINLLEHCYYTDAQFVAQAVERSETFSYLPIKIYNYTMGSSSQSVSMAGYIRHAYDHEKALDAILPIVSTNPKFANAFNNHYSYLPNDQLYIFMLDKKFKSDFFRYYKKMKASYPQVLKKRKIYIKFSCKSSLFYNICCKFFSKKVNS